MIRRPLSRRSRWDPDPFYSNVVLQLAMSGPSGSTVFQDSSPLRNTVTVYGDARLSAANSKFGGMSGLFDGNGDYLTVASSSAFDMEDKDFTLECYVYLASSKYHDLFNKPDASGVSTFRLDVTDTNQMWAYIRNQANSAWTIIGPVAFSTLTWHHVAFVRASTSLLLFLDGMLAGTNSYSGLIYSNSYPVSLGSIQTTAEKYYLNGYLDKVRFTKGVARYGAAFVPPDLSFLGS